MPEIGDTVEGYRIDALIGRGGMGAVYEATQLSLDRTVALKVITGELSKEPAFRERFRREGLLQASLEHPHIVTVYEAGESEHGLFLAMRLIRGPNLKDLIVARQLDVGRTLRILAPGRRRARRRPRSRVDPPRHQAAQHPGRRRPRSRVPRGLRRHEGARGPIADAHRRARRDARLHLA